MSQTKTYNERLIGIGKDILIIILVVVPLSFLNLRFAIVVGTICTVILMIRRITLELNPSFINGPQIYFEGKQLSLPSNVDVFELSDSSSFERLNKYTEVLRFMALPV